MIFIFNIRTDDDETFAMIRIVLLIYFQQLPLANKCYYTLVAVILIRDSNGQCQFQLRGISPD